MSRFHSPAVNWLAAFLMPPVGLILLWLRPASLWKKLSGSVAIAGIAVAYLVLLFGLRVELDGSGARPIFTFRDRDRHAAAIEKSRQEMTVAPPAAPSSDAVLAAAPPEPLPAPAPAAEPPKPAAAPPAPAPRPYWTDYRGPLRDGHYKQTRILAEWPEAGLERLWKIPIGLGYASMVVAGNRLFTIDQRRDQEVIGCYDVKTGRQIWAHSYAASFQESMGGDGPRATPTWHDGWLYSLGATGKLKVLDAATGAIQWEKDILKDNGAENLQWGMSAAPLIVDDMVVVQPGGTAGKSVVAYHNKTGKRVWSSLDDRQAYTSPMLVTLAGVRQILTVTGKRMVGLSPSDGKLLWDFEWITSYDANSSQPIVVDGNHVLVSAGYGHGAALVKIDKSGDGLSATQVWFNKKMKNKFNSSVLLDGYIYGMDEAIMACVRVSDGEQMWKGGRYGYGQLLLADGRLVVLTETGDLVLVKATPEAHTELARFSAIEGKTWNVPAMADGVLFVRNLAEMAAFRISPAKQ